MQDFELDAFVEFGIAKSTPKVSSSQPFTASDEEVDPDQMLLDFYGAESTPKNAKRIQLNALLDVPKENKKEKEKERKEMKANKVNKEHKGTE